MQMNPVFLQKYIKKTLPLLNSLDKHLCFNNKLYDSGTLTSHDPHFSVSFSGFCDE